jgi:hypothetical protein
MVQFSLAYYLLVAAATLVLFRVHLSIRSKYPHLVCSLVVVVHLLDVPMNRIYTRLLLIPPS